MANHNPVLLQMVMDCPLSRAEASNVIVSSLSESAACRQMTTATSAVDSPNDVGNDNDDNDDNDVGGDDDNTMKRCHHHHHHHHAEDGSYVVDFSISSRRCAESTDAEFLCVDCVSGSNHNLLPLHHVTSCSSSQTTTSGCGPSQESQSMSMSGMPSLLCAPLPPSCDGVRSASIRTDSTGEFPNSLQSSEPSSRDVFDFSSFGDLPSGRTPALGGSQGMLRSILSRVSWWRYQRSPPSPLDASGGVVFADESMLHLRNCRDFRHRHQTDNSAASLHNDDDDDEISGTGNSSLGTAGNTKMRSPSFPSQSSTVPRRLRSSDTTAVASAPLQSIGGNNSSSQREEPSALPPMKSVSGLRESPSHYLITFPLRFADENVERMYGQYLAKLTRPRVVAIGMLLLFVSVVMDIPTWLEGSQDQPLLAVIVLTDSIELTAQLIYTLCGVLPVFHPFLEETLVFTTSVIFCNVAARRLFVLFYLRKVYTNPLVISALPTFLFRVLVYLLFLNFIFLVRTRKSATTHVVPIVLTLCQVLCLSLTPIAHPVQMATHISVWVYGMVGVIAIVCFHLGAYMAEWHTRQIFYTCWLAREKLHALEASIEDSKASGATVLETLTSYLKEMESLTDVVRSFEFEIPEELATLVQRLSDLEKLCLNAATSNTMVDWRKHMQNQGLDVEIPWLPFGTSSEEPHGMHGAAPRPPPLRCNGGSAAVAATAGERGGGPLIYAARRSTPSPKANGIFGSRCVSSSPSADIAGASSIPSVWCQMDTTTSQSGLRSRGRLNDESVCRAASPLSQSGLSPPHATYGAPSAPSPSVRWSPANCASPASDPRALSAFRRCSPSSPFYSPATCRSSRTREGEQDLHVNALHANRKAKSAWAAFKNSVCGGGASAGVGLKPPTVPAAVAFQHQQQLGRKPKVATSAPFSPVASPRTVLDCLLNSDQTPRAAEIGKRYAVDMFQIEKLTQGNSLVQVGYTLLHKYTHSVSESSRRDFLSHCCESSDQRAPDGQSQRFCSVQQYDAGASSTLGCSSTVVLNFLTAVQQQYRQNSYHNSVHAALVTHLGVCLSHMLGLFCPPVQQSPSGAAAAAVPPLRCQISSQQQQQQQQCSPSSDAQPTIHKTTRQRSLDEVAFIVAALGHDVGHPGRNNLFFVHASEALALVYNDLSVLENYHAYLTFRSLSVGGRGGSPSPFAASGGAVTPPKWHSDPHFDDSWQTSTNIFEYVSAAEYRTLRKYIIEWILATDMAHHFPRISNFRVRRSSPAFNISENSDDMSLAAALCLKAADVGHASMEWPFHYDWCQRVIEEFYAQGDEEARRCLTVSPLCDRAKHGELPKSQCGFIQFVVLPLLTELEALAPLTSECLSPPEQSAQKTRQQRDAPNETVIGSPTTSATTWGAGRSSFNAITRDVVGPATENLCVWRLRAENLQVSPPPLHSAHRASTSPGGVKLDGTVEPKVIGSTVEASCGRNDGGERWRSRGRRCATSVTFAEVTQHAAVCPYEKLEESGVNLVPPLHAKTGSAAANLNPPPPPSSSRSLNTLRCSTRRKTFGTVERISGACRC